jgi:parallel beta helix pectate lyase-like protein
MNPRLSSLLVAMLITAGAEAAQRTFVSAGTGSDANPCTRPQPCRNFAAAISQTDVGGEAVVLDSGGYGVVSITQAVSLISPAGVYAGITAFSGDAVTVNVDNAVVTLRGLSLHGLGGENGIYFTGQTMSASNTRLHVENCVISGFTFSGLWLARNGTLSMSELIARDNGHGIVLDGSPSLPSTASIHHALLLGNLGNGLGVRNAAVTIRDSVAAGNNDVGFWATAEVPGSTVDLSAENCQATHSGNGFLAGPGPGPARLTISNSVASLNGTAITAATNGTVRVSNTTVTRNGTGLMQTGSGVFRSRGNNTVDGNSTETTGTITTFGPQ